MPSQEIVDNNDPTYRIVKNFLNDEDYLLIQKDLISQSEDHWNFEFEKVYPKENEVSKDYWIGIKDWKGMSINLQRRNVLEQNGMSWEFYSNIINNAKQTIEDRFGVKVKLEQSLLNRWRVGREQKPHVDYLLDSEGKDYSPLYEYGMNDDFINTFKQNYSTKHFSTIIYINDDYEGGQLYFPQYNKEIQPIKNSAISFKGDVNHLHGVKMVESGIRYTISLFWTETA
jgi:hypothetical protein